MTYKVVVDASVGISWAHPAQATKATDSLLEEVGRGTRVVVPTLWLTEIANALLVLERRKKIKEEERVQALTTLSGLNPVIDESGHCFTFTQVSELAAAHGLTVYDATYLELAQRERIPLVTKDGALRDAAAKIGVVVV